jgi:hypothetical protein
MRVVNCGYEGSPEAHNHLIYYGATLKVNLGLDSTWHRGLNAPPKLGIYDVEALIDTGAEESCIDSALASALKLPVIDRRVVCGVGSMEVDVFIGHIHVPALKFTIEGRFSGVPLDEHGHRQKVLLGRTFLRYCTLAYNGNSAKVTVQLADRSRDNFGDKTGNT